MKDIFSSLDFAAKFDLSKKLRVEIDNDEKNEWDGRELGVGLLCGCRVIRETSIAAPGTLLSNADEQVKTGHALKISVETCHARKRPPSMFPYAPQISEVFERGFTLEMHRMYHAAQRIHVRGGVQDFVEGIFWSCGSNVSVMVLSFKGGIL